MEHLSRAHDQSVFALGFLHGPSRPFYLASEPSRSISGKTSLANGRDHLQIIRNIINLVRFFLMHIIFTDRQTVNVGLFSKMGLWNCDPIRSPDLDERSPFSSRHSFPEDVLDMDMNPDAKFGLCSVLAGSLISTFLSGMCSLQTFLYVKQYLKDPMHLKALVFLVWGMDTVQTCCIVSLSFQYTILHFTNPDIVDHIFISVVAAVLLTALLTFTVNGFFAYKVHKLSEGNMWLTVPTAICMLLRLGLALITIVKLSDLQSYTLYGRSYSPLLTASLSLSALTDLIITGGLCYYLRALNPDLYRTRKMLSTIVSFADNNGALTCVVALSSLICWIVIPHKLVYLALHFTIGKCYSNSLLATLNMRNYVKRTAVTPVDVINIMNPICLPPNQRASYPMPMRPRAARIGYDVYHEEEKEEATGTTERTMGALEIKVDRIVQYG